jgi:hypothetical protein
LKKVPNTLRRGCLTTEQAWRGFGLGLFADRPALGRLYEKLCLCSRLKQVPGTGTVFDS